MPELAELRRILAYREAVDMRKSIDGLVALVQGALREDPLSGSLFVFVNRRGNYLKAVYWDRTGFCLFAKRLERGRFAWPGSDSVQTLSQQTFRLVLDGIVLGFARRLR
jgi:transposase